MRSWILILLVFLTLQGCGSIRMTPYQNAKYPPTNPDTIEVVENFPFDPATAEIIGEVHVQENTADLFRDSLFLKRLRKRAARLGADVVVLRRGQGRVYTWTNPATSTTNTDFSLSPYGSHGTAHSTTTYYPSTTHSFEGYEWVGFLLKYKERI